MARGHWNEGMSWREGWSVHVAAPAVWWSIALLRRTPVSKSSLGAYPRVLPRLRRINGERFRCSHVGDVLSRSCLR